MNIRELVVSLGFEVEEKPLDAVNERLEHIHHTLEFLAAAEIVKGLFEIAERFAGMGESIEGAAISAGITTDAFQKLSYAASQNAIGEGELSGSLARLNRALYEAKTGSDSAQKSFAEAGITPDQLQSFTSSKDALYALSDQFSRIQDPIKKQALAMQLFGRSGYTMVKMLSQGSGALDEMGESAEKMGAVLDEHQVENLAKLEMSLSSLFGIFKKLGAAIGASFAPNVISAVNALKGFIAANRTLIMAHVKEWVDKIAYGLGFVIGVVMETTKRFLAFAAVHPKLVDAVEKVVEVMFAVAVASGIAVRGFSLVKSAVGDVKGVLGIAKDAFELFGKAGSLAWRVPLMLAGVFQKALVGIATRLALLVAESFPALGAALSSFAAALSATPVGVIAAGIAAIVVAAHDLWTVLSGGKAEDMWTYKFLKMLELIPGKIAAVWRYMTGAKDAPNSLMDALSFKAKPGDAGVAQAAKSFASQVSPDATQQALAEQPKAVADANSFIDRWMDSHRSAQQNLEVKYLDKPSPQAASSTPNNSIAVSAPITINVPAGTSPEQTQKSVRQAISEHMDDLHRSAMREMQTAKAY